MVSNMVTTWQERMLDCVALPKDLVAPADTVNVGIVDRSYTAGRAFLNLPDLTTFIQVCCHDLEACPFVSLLHDTLPALLLLLCMLIEAVPPIT